MRMAANGSAWFSFMILERSQCLQQPFYNIIEVEEI